MDVLTPVVTGALLAVFAVVLDRLNKVRIEALRDELRAFKDDTNRRFEDVNRRFERLENEVAALRSDLTQIALAVGARPQPHTG